MEAKKAWVFVSLPLLLSLAITARSNGGSGGSDQEISGVTLTGTISQQPAQKAVPLGGAKMLAAVQSADSVWAIPIAKMQGANIDRINLMLKKTSTPMVSTQPLLLSGS